MVLRHIVTRLEDGTELRVILRRVLGLSATQVKRLKRVPGGILLGGGGVFTNHLVSAGDEIVCDLGAAEPEGDIVPEDGPLAVLFEDEGLLAVNKPPEVLVHPSRAKYTGTLSNYVLGYMGRRGGDAACHSVNRLDRDTSGVVLFAKNAHVKHLAAQALRGGEARKEYVALVFGAPSETQGTIDLPIRRLRERDMRRVVAADGDRAVTCYRTLCTGTLMGEPMSAVAFRLLTGRTHQIRVHCLEMGFPILGDVLYHTPESEMLSQKLGLAAQQLHCRTLALRHPLAGEMLTLSAPVDRADMGPALEALGAEVQ